MVSNETFGIDNDRLYSHCLDIEKDVLEKFGHLPTGVQLSAMIGDKSINPKAEQSFKPSAFKCDAKAANLFPHYNIIRDYPSEDLMQVQKEIERHLKENFNVPSGTYYLHIWINILRFDESIGWHYHRIPDDKSWHGVYYVFAEGSYTIFGDNYNVTKVIPSKNGFLSMTETDEKMDATDIWQNKDKHRVTLGYDIYTKPYPQAIPIHIK